MKFIAIFFLTAFPLIAAAGDHVPVNIRLRALAGKHAEATREATKEANARYLEGLQLLKQQRIRHDDLRAAIIVDDEIKRFQKAQKCAHLIVRLAGTWKFTTTGNTFLLFADGTAAAPDGKNIGRIEVVDPEKRIVRLSAHTWRVSADERALRGDIKGGARHPARRVESQANQPYAPKRR